MQNREHRMQNAEIKRVRVWGVIIAVLVCTMIIAVGCEKAQNAQTGGSTKIVSEAAK